MARIRELELRVQEAETFEERQRAQVELHQAMMERERRLTLAKREERRNQLMQELEDIRSNVEQQRDAFISAKEAELRYLEDEYYPELLKDARINMKAYNAIVEGSQRELLEILQSAEFLGGWEAVGKSFGERWFEGFQPWVSEVLRLIQVVTGARTAAGIETVGGAGKLTPESEAALRRVQEANQKIIAAKYTYESAAKEFAELRQAGTLTPQRERELLGKMEQAHREAEEARKQGGTIPATVSYKEVTGLEVKHEGGIIGRPSGEMPGWFRRLLDLGPREVPAILEEGELVLSRRIAGALGRAFSGLRPISQPVVAAAPAGVVNNYYIDVHDNTFRDGTDLGARLWQELRRRGR